jgi:3-phosphoshikimate 1-carboxyvinyltransferase
VLRARGLPSLPMQAALTHLGLRVQREREEIAVEGHVSEPRAAIDGAGSLTCLAALAGLLSAQPFASELVGHDDVVRGGMAPVARVLRQRGAHIEGRLDPDRPREIAPPIRIEPARLSSTACELTPREWPAKIALLMSGLFADGETIISETMPGDDRAERLLAALGLPIEGAGPHLRLVGPVASIPPFDAAIPGDGELAANILLAGMAVPESDVGVRDVGLSPARRGFLDALGQAGARLMVEPKSERCGTPIADVRVLGAPAGRAIAISDELGLRAGASLAALAAMAAVVPVAGSESEIADTTASNVAHVLAMLESFGIAARASPRGIRVRAMERPLRAGVIRTEGDAAVAMAAVSLALGAEAPCVVDQAESIVASFPRFVGSLRALGANIDVEP